MIVTLPDGCRCIGAASKCSTTCEDALLSPSGGVATFVDCTEDAHTYAISHTEALWCCRF